jgi:hypothetical protein
MKFFNLNEKEYQVPESWTEMTLKLYVNVSKLEEKRAEYFLGELYLLKIIEAICDAEDGELDELTLEVVNDISSSLGFLQQQTDWPNVKTLEIEGVTYVFPQDLNKLTMGEYISMKTFQENAKSQSEAIPYILAIILRPGKLVQDGETGEEKWVQDKFTANNIDYRKELFLNQPVMDLMGPIGFFLGGKQ